MVTKICQVVTKDWLESLLSGPLEESLKERYESLQKHLIEGIDGLPVIRSNLLDAHRARLFVQLNLQGEKIEMDIPMEHYSALEMGKVNLETMTLQK
jgi:hypothetical protein